jgi:cytoskeletal protein CcmA (bactofilin family)
MSKNIRRGLSALLLVVLATVLLAVPVSAAEVRGLDDVTVASGEVIDDDLYLAGNTITIDGTVNGDLWAVGGTVTINGRVNGDVLAVVGTFSLDGEASQAVRVVASTIDINGSIGGDLLVAGSELNIGRWAIIGGDLLFAASRVGCDGIIYGYIRGSGDEVSLAGGVGGDVKLTADNLTVGYTADIRGALTYSSENEADIQAGAQITGEVCHQQPGLKWRFWEGVIPSIIGKLLAFLMILLIGILIVVLAPKRIALMSDTISNKPWFSLGWGAIILFGTPIAFVIVCFTLVGIPLALIALALYGIAIYLAQIPAALFIGRWIIGLSNKKTDAKGIMVGALALGLAVLCLLRLIPYAGWVFGLAAVLFGLGGVLVSFKPGKSKRR